MLILQTTENELIGAAGVAKFFGGGKKNCMVNADTFPIDFDAKKTDHSAAREIFGKHIESSEVTFL
jgi:hypothetical protein